jgi:hypothetical protein
VIKLTTHRSAFRVEHAYFLLVGSFAIFEASRNTEMLVRTVDVGAGVEFAHRVFVHALVFELTIRPELALKRTEGKRFRQRILDALFNHNSRCFCRNKNLNKLALILNDSE